ncbi:MAG: cupin domain-containing protein [Cyanobacteria bacterium]|nr:cupin domain-containing protein [Cyanobacteriota bacterium]
MTTVAILIGSTAFAQTQAPPAPAPAPGSPAIFKPAADLAAVLANANVNAGGMSSSNVTTTDQYRVSVVKRDKAAGALAHPGNTELLYIVDGEGTMVTGGKLIAAANGKPASINEGVSQRFVKGDVFIVPAGSPHWFSAIDKPVTYLEVRWLAPK